MRAHAVARAVFEMDRMWDAVRPLDNRVSAAIQVELRTEATRLAERATRWLLRLPALVADPGRADRGAGGAVRLARGGGAVRAAGWLLGARRRRTPSGPGTWRRRACPRTSPPTPRPRR